MPQQSADLPMMVVNMAYSANIRRFRSTKKRVQRIRFTTSEKWFAVFLLLLGLLSVAVGGWLGIHYSD
jgi:polyferredoxin